MLCYAHWATNGSLLPPLPDITYFYLKYVYTLMVQRFKKNVNKQFLLWWDLQSAFSSMCKAPKVDISLPLILLISSIKDCSRCGKLTRDNRVALKHPLVTLITNLPLRCIPSSAFCTTNYRSSWYGRRKQNSNYLWNYYQSYNW